MVLSDQNREHFSHSAQWSYIWTIVTGLSEGRKLSVYSKSWVTSNSKSTTDIEFFWWELECFIWMWAAVFPCYLWIATFETGMSVFALWPVKLSHRRIYSSYCLSETSLEGTPHVAKLTEEKSPVVQRDLHYGDFGSQRMLRIVTSSNDLPLLFWYIHRDIVNTE